MSKDNKRGGPNTEEGKARSSMNSLRHGLTGKTIVLPTEDPAQFQELLTDYVRDFKPGSSIEMDLVHELVVCRWRLQRIWSMETTAFEITLSRKEEDIDKEFINPTNWMKTALVYMEMAEKSKALTLMLRYETRITRRYDQILKELKALQDQRQKTSEPPSEKNCQTNSPKPIIVPKPAPVLPGIEQPRRDPNRPPAA